MNITYQSQIFQTIKSFAGEKNILAVPKSFIRFCDENLYTGLFLSQIIYLSDKGSREDGFIYKSNKEWKEDYFLSDYAIRQAKKYLEDKGIIETKLIKANGAPTTHYKLKKEKFTELFMKFLQNEEATSNGIVENNETLTEITTEINNNKKNNKKSEFEKISQVFQKAFSTTPNNFQLEKIKEFMLNGISEQLIIKTIEYCGLGGHNQSFFFNRLSMLLEDEIYNIDQLNSVLSQNRSLKNNSGDSGKDNLEPKNNQSASNYKWKDFFIDYDKYKE